MSRLEQTLEGAAKCAKHCELQVSLLVSWCHHVAGFPVIGGIGNVWFSVGSQLLQSPLTAASLMVLLYGGPLGEQHFSVFSLRYLLVPSVRFLLQPGVRGALQAYWKAASPGPICRYLLRSLRYFAPCAAGMRCGHGCSLWPRELELLCVLAD